MKAITCFIIEDEEPSRDFLLHLLEESDFEVEVKQTFGSLTQAAPFIQESPPELLFMDIQMPGKLGIQIKDLIPDFNLPVVYITAYENYAVNAFEIGAIDYLLKPIGQDEVNRALGRFIERFRNQEEEKTFVVSSSDKHAVLASSEILALEADANYTKIHLNDGSSELISKNLGTVLEELGSAYLRVHAKYAVRKKSVIRLEKGKPNLVVLSSGLSFPISVRKRSLVVQALKTVD